MDATQKFIVVVNGPTASGKTACAIEIARHFDGEIISADSRQFFREMNIGTAKPSAAERALAPHHLLDNRSISQTYTAGDFERDALELIAQIQARGRLPIICGGSGLYIKALLHGLDDTAVPPQVREEVRALYAENGLSGLQAELQRLDPEYYALVDRKNHVRIMRAIELIRATGGMMKDLLKGEGKPRDFEAIKIGLEVDRDALYQRINARVDEMITAGLEAEARSLEGYKNTQALQTVGYKELFAYFEGAYTFEKAVEMIKQNTRRYAKRQLTWLRKEGDISWFNPSRQLEINDFIQSRIRSS